MGVYGLTSFVDSLDNVFSNHKLKECNLLIDGYGILHFLNSRLEVMCQFGGNYTDLHIYLNNFLNLLIKCKIQSYFIFDGARDPNEGKSLKRAKDRLRSINSNNGNLQQILPICAYRILIELLNEHKIKYYQCNFEADYEIAVLANSLFKCPILSNDSDYYIYNLKFGYIPIDKLDFVFDSDTSGLNYLNSKLYKIEVFCKKFQLEIPSIMPIFAVLCGTDTVDQHVFQSFMNSFINENNNKNKSKINYIKKRFNLYTRVLKWLSESKSDVENCIERILKFIKKDSHDEIRGLIQKSIDNYFDFKNDKIFVDIENVSSILTKVEDSNAVVDFTRKYNEFKFSRLCNDLLLYKSVIYSCQIEFIDWPSTYLSSVEIRRIFYSLMFQKYSKNESLNENIIVKEYLRQSNNLKIFEVEIYRNFKSTTGINFFNQLLPKTVVDSMAKFKAFNNEIKVFYFILYYWLSNKTFENISQKFKNLNSIRAFIVSFIKYSIIDSLNHDHFTDNNGNLKVLKDKFQSFDDYFNYLQDINMNSSDNLGYLKEIDKKLNEYEKKTNEKKLNIKLIHFMCEFQAIYQSLAFIDEFFENETKFELIKLNKFFNGSFLYNFSIELNSRVNADLFVEEFFSRKSVFSSLYKFLFDSFIKFFNIDDTKPLKNEIENTKIQEKNKKENNETIEILNEDLKILFIDKNNKFSCLSEY